MESTLALAELDGLALAERIRTEWAQFTHARDVFISAGRVALERAVALGELFTAALDKFPGNYEEWVESTFDGEISKVTAWRFRQCFQHRAKVLADEPALATLKDAYVHLGLLPPPEPDTKPEPTARPLYQLRLVIDTKPFDQWPKIELQDFVTQTTRIAELRAQAIARLAEL